MYSPAGWRAVAESFWLSLSEIKSKRGCCTTNLSCYCFGRWKIATVTCSLTGRRQLVCKHLPTTSRAVVKPEKKCARNRKQRIFTLKKANTFQKGVAFTLKANSFVSRTVSLCLESSWGMFVDKLACPCKLQETAAVCKQPKLVQGTIKVVMTQPQCNHLQEEAN